MRREIIPEVCLPKVPAHPDCLTSRALRGEAFLPFRGLKRIQGPCRPPECRLESVGNSSNRILRALVDESSDPGNGARLQQQQQQRTQRTDEPSVPISACELELKSTSSTISMSSSQPQNVPALSTTTPAFARDLLIRAAPTASSSSTFRSSADAVFLLESGYLSDCISRNSLESQYDVPRSTRPAPDPSAPSAHASTWSTRRPRRRRACCRMRSRQLPPAHLHGLQLEGRSCWLVFVVTAS